jgi:integrase
VAPSSIGRFETSKLEPTQCLGSIKQQIAVGTFSFPNEFPDYRYLRRVVGTASIRSCNQVMDEFLAHCESRVSRNDMASVTVRSYRKVLDGVWRPALGKHLFHQVRYSHLVRASDWQHWSKKTYNNAISVIRRAFEFGYSDHRELPNPAAGLRTVRLKRQDRQKIDPFNIQGRGRPRSGYSGDQACDETPSGAGTTHQTDQPAAPPLI